MTLLYEFIYIDELGLPKEELRQRVKVFVEENIASHFWKPGYKIFEHAPVASLDGSKRYLYHVIGDYLDKEEI